MKDKNQQYESFYSYDKTVEAELLASLIFDNNNINYIEFVKQKYFYFPVNQEIFGAILALVNRDSEANIRNITDFLSNCSEFKNISCEDYLKDIYKHIGGMGRSKDLGKIIKNLYIKRNLHSLGTDICKVSSEVELFNVQESIKDTEEKLYEISNVDSSGKRLLHVNNAFSSIMSRLDHIRKFEGDIIGIPTKLKNIDILLGGLKPSDLIIIAARPSMGKTALAVTFAYNIASHFLKNNPEKQRSVAFFSLEMSSEQLAIRISSIHLQIKNINVDSRVFSDGHFHETDGTRGRKIKDSDFEEIGKGVAEMDKLPLYIDDTPAITVNELASKLRWAKKRNNIEIVFVDYLQLLKGKRNDGNRVQEVTDITQGLKAIAKELNIPIIALSQLSRAVEQRDDKRPQLSDLRESGSIEQDADIVSFLYRESYYKRRKEPERPGSRPNESDILAYESWCKRSELWEKWDEECRDIDNLAELIIGKNRNGPIGKIDLAFDHNTTRFTDRTTTASGVPIAAKNKNIDAIDDF